MGGYAVEETAPWWMPVLQLAGCIVAIGVIAAVVELVRALFGTVDGIVGWIPYANRVIQKPLHAIEHKVVNGMLQVEHHLDARVADYWHNFANVYASIGHEIYGLAVADAQFYYAIFHKYALPVLAPRVHYAERAAARAQAQADRAHAKAQATAQAQAHAQRYAIPHAINAGTLPLERELHGIEAGVRTWERWAEHAIDTTIPHDIAAVRERAQSLENGAINTFRWIRTHPASLATAAFAGAVAVALRRLGLGWLRCGNVKGVGKALCGLSRDLIESLLADAIDAFLITNLCDFIMLLSFTAKEFEPLLLAFVDVEDVLIGCNGATKPAPLPLRAAALPPVTGFAALAA